VILAPWAGGASRRPVAKRADAIAGAAAHTRAQSVTGLNIRVADIAAVYADWSAKGAQFLTEPIDRGPEIRCYLRDPDGHLIEVGQSRG